MENLTLTYLSVDDLVTKLAIVDLLGVMATNKSWTMLVDHVITVTDPQPDLVSRAIAAFVDDSNRYPEVKACFVPTNFSSLMNFLTLPNK